MTRLAYLDCVGGLAGDMVLGALLDAGAPAAALEETVRALGLDDVKVEVERADRGGVRATAVRVVEIAPPADRPASELVEVVERADLPPRVLAGALEALRRLIGAEARVHDVAADELVLHEVGGVDTIVDVVGAFALLETLAVDEVVCSPIPFSRAIVPAAHGPIPTPGPAVLEILRGATLVGTPVEQELVTPTGAAIAAAMTSSFGEAPPLVLEAVGYGAGGRELADRPNVLRVVIGHRASTAPRRDAVLLEATVDDLLPELVPDVVDACREAGALDVWTTPVQMKKGRTGVGLSAVARPTEEWEVARALIVHGTTLGVRATPIRRYELERSTHRVEVGGHEVRVKVGRLDGRVVNVAPEHDDCARVAATTGRTVKDVWAEALLAGRDLAGPDDLAR